MVFQSSSVCADAFYSSVAADDDSLRPTRSRMRETMKSKPNQTIVQVAAAAFSAVVVKEVVARRGI